MPGVVYAAFLVAAGVGLAAIADRTRPFSWPLWLFVGVATCTSVAAWLGLDDPTDYVAQGFVPRPEDDAGFDSSTACRSCHPSQHASWHRTFHRTMTQVVGPTTVVAPFRGEVVESEGLQHTFVRRGEEFFVEVTGPGRPPLSLRVVMSTGSHHYQLYWLQSPLHTEPNELPIYWNIAQQRWIPKMDTVIAPPGKPNGSGSWNTHCIRCHSVNGKPGFQPGGSYDSTVVELGIGCEACHGPGREHIRAHQNPLHRYRSSAGNAGDPSIVNPARLDAKGSSQVCGRCHGAYSQDMEQLVLHGYSYRPGDDLTREVRFYDTDDPKPGFEEYIAMQSWKDGTTRTGGDEYNAHMKSPCFTAGELSCVSCHSLHESDPNDQLARDMDGNHACVQCHDDVPPEHSHHAEGSAGSLCYNCHMPNTTWALSTAMRAHRVDSPDAALAAQTGRPHACNLCHLDKTLAWTSEKLSAWYGQTPAELTDAQQTLAMSVTGLLSGDAVQRAIWAWHFGWAPARAATATDFAAPLLTELLEDPYSQVRYIAGVSLQAQSGFADFEYDFIAPAPQRAHAKSRALALWQKQSTRETRAEVLYDAEGHLDRERVAELTRARDDTPIELPE